VVTPAAQVSVVVPTHNRRDLLAVTLRTVLWQRDVDMEVLVVDDGSTDGTARTVGALGDPRVRLVRHQTTRGLSAARNSGIRAATGEWLAFVDDDDLWAPDKLARQLTAAVDQGRWWAYAGSVTIDGNGRVLGGSPPPPPDVVMQTVRARNPIPAGASNVLIHKDAIARCGLFDPRCRAAEDWDLWIRVAELGPPALADRPLVAQRVHAHNMSGDASSILAGIAWIERQRNLRVDRGDVHRWLAESSLRQGNRGRTLVHWAAAARHGAGRGVLRDVGTAVRRRVPLRRQPPMGPGGPPLTPWQAQTEAWLSILRSDAFATDAV
jgi:glycosyltransferase involved in cell wall biosynthesis